MRLVNSFAAAIILASAVFAYASVQLPHRVLACMCVRTDEALIDIARKDPITIVVGTVGVAQQDRTPLAVDTWFHGPFPADVVWLMGGTGMRTSCDAPITAGERRFLVLWGGPTAPGAHGQYSASMCEPTGVIGTPQGDALLAEATAAFAARPPPSPEPGHDAVDLSPWLATSGLAWVAVASAAALTLLGVVVLIARRRPWER